MYDAYRIKPKKKRSKKAKFRLCIFVILIVFAIIFVYYQCVVRPIITSLTEEKVRSLSTITISAAIGQVLEETPLDYEDLVAIEYDSNQNVKHF